MRGEQLFKVGNFTAARDRHKINFDVVLIAKLLLNPACIVIIGYIPALESAFINRNIQADLFGKSLGVILISTACLFRCRRRIGRALRSVLIAPGVLIVVRRAAGKQTGCGKQSGKSSYD
ncbi:hypothetical protein D3C73_1348160 [compost metagenome]